MVQCFRVKLVALAMVVAHLSACGAGAGTIGASPAAPAPAAASATFTRFSAISANTPTPVTGASQESTYAWDSATDKITSVGATSTFGPTATVVFTNDANGNPTSVALTSAQGTSLSFGATSDVIGYVIADPRIGALLSANEQNLVLYAIASKFGWDYQTFGSWYTGVGTSSGTFGSFSIGSPTPVASVPTTGTASYTGATGGRYVDSSGGYFFTNSNLSATVDFAARSIAFNTAGTQVTADLSTYTANNNLNLSGTLTYASGSNQFSGTVSSVGGGSGNAAMTGTAKGSFYGPTAQEIGGGFAVKESGLAGYAGSFGAKR